jgi:hypothetical protein
MVEGESFRQEPVDDGLGEAAEEDVGLDGVQQIGAGERFESVAQAGGHAWTISGEAPAVLSLVNIRWVPGAVGAVMFAFGGVFQLIMGEAMTTVTSAGSGPVR